MQEGFYMDVSTALLFYRYCQRYKITGREEKIAAMRRMVKKHRVKYLRDPEEFIKGKKILKLKRKGDNT